MTPAPSLVPGVNTPEDRANESFFLAKQAMVLPGANLDEAYYLPEEPIVDRQLSLAGLRLARVLNEELGNFR